MKRLALAFLLCVAAGCAHKATPPPTASVPAPPPKETPAQPPAQTPSTPPSQVSAPWDTNGTASARAARRNHVYPSGTNPLGQRLVDSLPDPAKMMKDGENEENHTSSPPPPKPLPVPVSDSQCWEVQVLVTTDVSKAKSEAKAIETRLNLSAWVKSDGAIHRVRVGGCLTSDGASELANRLKGEGYPEAFRTKREP